MPSSRRTLLVSAASALASAGTSPSASAATAQLSAMASDQDVLQALHRATLGHIALMQGDLASYQNAISLTDDFTLMSPFGGRISHASSLSQPRWREIAAFFKEGRDSTVELLQAYKVPGMVVLVVVERAHVAVGKLAAQDWPLRVTLVFRKDGGAWKLAHRHADPLVPGVTVEQAARLAGGLSV